ncbi:hypothetical protein D3C87_1292100 [compost metagenome]
MAAIDLVQSGVRLATVLLFVQPVNLDPIAYVANESGGSESYTCLRQVRQIACPVLDEVTVDLAIFIG